MDAGQMYRMCLKKRKYKTEKQAKEAAIHYTEKYQKEHRVYYCRLCGCFHLTTKQDTKKKEQ